MRKVQYYLFKQLHIPRSKLNYLSIINNINQHHQLSLLLSFRYACVFRLPDDTDNAVVTGVAVLPNTL